MPTPGLSQKLPKWYFGAMASCGAATVTQPIDLIKVQLQTNREEKWSAFRIIRNIIKERGVVGLYSGLSSSLVCQIIYATTRFTIYEALKERIENESLFIKLAMGLLAGAVAGIVANPTDVVTVRMQNDLKLPPEARRNYKHALDGLVKIIRDEGGSVLLYGMTFAIARGILMTMGQLACYDHVKQVLLLTRLFKDNVVLHLLSSIMAGVISTFITQPVDMLKTTMMVAEPGLYSNIFHVIRVTCKLGICVYYKGYLASSIRIIINTVVIFLIYEQLKVYFGLDPPDPPKRTTLGTTAATGNASSADFLL